MAREAFTLGRKLFFSESRFAELAPFVCRVPFRSGIFDWGPLKIRLIWIAGRYCDYECEIILGAVLEVRGGVFRARRVFFVGGSAVSCSLVVHDLVCCFSVLFINAVHWRSVCFNKKNLFGCNGIISVRVNENLFKKLLYDVGICSVYLSILY